jgi:hypothetical protein
MRKGPNKEKGKLIKKETLRYSGHSFHVMGYRMKFIEFGTGNTWVVRTETELEDGTEYEEKGIIRPIKFQSIYLRIWFLKTVVIVDYKEGFKKMKKNRTAFKLIIGITSN